ncbi:hypothetical protein F4818DRAFT_179904 [Hypoxylon cercidicola]|nr:hypothetical protein F4818DRAFT_179904 [Hypoxylon cercidicola]
MHGLFLLTSLAAAASATTYFPTVFAPNTEVDGALINAAGLGFYLSLEGPETYCPKNVKNCPPVEGTLVYAGLTGMAVQVPGGQRIYVAPNGQVRFTVAHSSSMPPGAMVGGWFNKTVTSSDPGSGSGSTRYVYDFLSTDGSNAGGVKICPDVPDAIRAFGAGYSLYVGTRAFNQTFCIDAVGLNLMPRNVSFGAWQYV